MTQEFLSQDEVDALLKGVTDDAEATSDKAPTQEDHAKTYHIGRQERIVRGRMSTLELINDRFVGYLRTNLFNYLHKSVEISAIPLKLQKYSEFISNLVIPTNLNLIQATPLPGNGLIVLDPNLVFLVVDNMFGGDGRFHTPTDGRDFTTTEQRIIQRFLNVIFDAYQKSWKPVYPLEFGYLRSEIDTQFISIATPSETVITLSFNITFSGNTSQMHVCLPYLMLEPIRDMLYGAKNDAPSSADKRWSSMLAKQLQTTELDLTAVLGTANVTLRDVLKMQVGDVIPFVIEDTVRATINEIPLIEARYGIQNGQLALKVERFLTGKDT